MNKNAWNLEDGLRLVRAIQGDAKKYGYHLTLGGSVLYAGKSEKDIDLYFLPTEDPKTGPRDRAGLVEWLERLWGMTTGMLPDQDEAPVLPPLQAFEPRFNPAGALFDEDNPLLGGVRIPQAPWKPRPRPNVAVRPFGVDIEQREPSPYSYRLMFRRPGGDRIDVFIL